MPKIYQKCLTFIKKYETNFNTTVKNIQCANVKIPKSQIPNFQKPLVKARGERYWRVEVKERKLEKPFSEFPNFLHSLLESKRSRVEWMKAERNRTEGEWSGQKEFDIGI